MSDSSHATTCSPSRRRLLHNAVALALPMPSIVVAADPALAIARQWSALELEQRRLTRQWQATETWLFRHRGWPKLTDAERRAVPEGAALTVIEAQLSEIDHSYGVLLPQLKRTPALSRAGTLAKLDALLWFLDKDDHPDARALLKSCRRDLKRLWF